MMNKIRRQTAAAGDTFGKLIDFHTHILPGMDDGSRSSDESIEMIEYSVKQGVGCIVLTPHFYPDHESGPEHFLKRRNLSLEALRAKLKTPGPILIPGAEVQYFHGISAMTDLPLLCVDKTKLLLLEMPFQKWSSYVLDDLFELSRKSGLQIVIAHIERYIEEQPKGTLEELLRHRILLQANAGAFLRRATAKKAFHMLKEGQIHFIGSDSHNMSSRPPNMGEWLTCTERKLGADAVSAIVTSQIRTLLQP